MQLHVHVAKLQPSLRKVLTDVAERKKKDWIGIVCPSGKLATDCQYNPDASKSNIHAIYVEAITPTEAQPYKVVYGGGGNVLTDSILVSRPTGLGFVILKISDRPVECFLSCESVCEDYCK